MQVFRRTRPLYVRASPDLDTHHPPLFQRSTNYPLDSMASINLQPYVYFSLANVYFHTIKTSLGVYRERMLGKVADRDTHFSGLFH